MRHISQEDHSAVFVVGHQSDNGTAALLCGPFGSFAVWSSCHSNFSHGFRVHLIFLTVIFKWCNFTMCLAGILLCHNDLSLMSVVRWDHYRATRHHLKHIQWLVAVFSACSQSVINTPWYHCWMYITVTVYTWGTFRLTSSLCQLVCLLSKVFFFNLENIFWWTM